MTWSEFLIGIHTPHNHHQSEDNIRKTGENRPFYVLYKLSFNALLTNSNYFMSISLRPLSL